MYSINPKSADRARERHRPSGAKDDALDAYVLADLVRTDRRRLRTIQPASPATRELRALVRLRDKLVHEKAAATLRLRGLLDEWAPDLSRLLDDFNRDWQRSLLLLAPLQADLCRMHGNQLNAFLRSHRIREQTADRIRSVRALEPISLPEGLKGPLQMEINVLVETISRCLTFIKEAETKMDACIEVHPDAEIFRSLPVKGTATTAALLSAFGESRQSPPPWQELAARWGVAPVTVQSGKSRHVKRRRACDHVINQALLFFSMNTAFKEDCWASDLYRKKRAAGIDHYSALRGVAQRWVKIINRLWRDRIPYDESVHRRNIALHGGAAA